MTYQEILKDIKQKKYKPVYFLHGTEPYYIDLLSKYIEKYVLTESEKSFNQSILYGKETDVKTLVDTASRYPMMASHQVVILKEAQEMRSLKDLTPYIERAVPTTILVICHKYKKFDGRTKFGKAIKKHALVFESKKLYDNQIPAWIENYLSAKKLTIAPDATNLIAEYLGENLSKVANELDKLAINVSKGTEVTTKIVQENIGISKEYNVFELQRAISQRDVQKANRIVNHFNSNPKKNPLVVVIGSLYNFFSKAYMTGFLRNLSDQELATSLGFSARNQYAAAFMVKDYKMAIRSFTKEQLEQAISVLKEMDLRSKGVDNAETKHDELLKEMIYKVLH